MIDIKRVLAVVVTLSIMLGSASMAANESADKTIDSIVLQLKERARKSSGDYMLKSPLAFLSVIARQMIIPPQRRQYLDLSYIQSVAPTMNELQPDCLPPLAQMLNSADSFERESVTELITFEPNTLKWNLTPEFDDAVARQILSENVSEIQMDLFRVVGQSESTSASLLRSLNKWVTKHYKDSDFNSTSGISAMAQAMSRAPEEWSADSNACFNTLVAVSKDRAPDIRYKALYAIESGFMANPGSKHVERFMDIVRVGIKDSDKDVVTTAIRAEAALGQHAAPYFKDTLLPIIKLGLGGNNPQVYSAAMEACASIGAPGANAALPFILKILTDGASAPETNPPAAITPEKQELWSAVVAAGGFGTELKPVRPALEKLAKSSDNFTRVYAGLALKNID